MRKRLALLLFGVLLVACDFSDGSDDVSLPTAPSTPAPRPTCSVELESEAVLSQSYHRHKDGTWYRITVTERTGCVPPRSFTIAWILNTSVDGQWFGCTAGLTLLNATEPFWWSAGITSREQGLPGGCNAGVDAPSSWPTGVESQRFHAWREYCQENGCHLRWRLAWRTCYHDREVCSYPTFPEL